MKRPGGRRREFEEFAQAHGAGLVKLAYNLCGDRERAEDAAQEALVGVYRRWTRIEDPLAYARRIAVNASRDDWRRSTRQDLARAALARDPVAEPTPPQELVLERDELMSAIDDLPQGQRTVVVLRYGSHLSEAETASVLGLSTGTVKSQCSRALAHLRESLTPTREPHPEACPA